MENFLDREKFKYSEPHANDSLLNISPLKSQHTRTSIPADSKMSFINSTEHRPEE